MSRTPTFKILGAAVFTKAQLNCPFEGHELRPLPARQTSTVGVNMIGAQLETSTKLQRDKFLGAAQMAKDSSSREVRARLTAALSARQAATPPQNGLPRGAGGLLS